MKFSILIPVYNVELYLKQCLDSVVKQSFKDFEVILVDDGSTDNSGKICDEYAKKYPNIIKIFHKKNEGLLLTRRFGLKKSQGEYIIFIDSDDYVSVNLLKTINEALNFYQCDMVIYNFYRFTDKEKTFEPQKIEYSNNTVFDTKNKHELYINFVLNHIFVNMWIKAVKRDIIDIEYDYKNWNVSKCEDVVQSFPLFNKAEKIVFIDKKLYFYRKNINSMTMQTRLSDYRDYLLCIEKTFEYIDIWKISSKIKEVFIEKQLSHFYSYLRNIEKKSKEIKDNNLLDIVIENLMNDIRFQKILNLVQIKNGKLNFRMRLFLFKFFMLRKNKYSVSKLIQISNLLGG